MCIEVPRNNKVMIARRNIRVYKRLRPWLHDVSDLISPYYREPYRLGREKTAITDFNRTVRRFDKHKKSTDDWDTIDLEHGLHSYADKTYAFTKCYGLEDVVCVGIIPKGARYIVGENNEIVSDRLIVQRIVRNPF